MAEYISKGAPEKAALKIVQIDGEYCVHRLSPSSKVPTDVTNSAFYWLGKTDEELSIVCRSDLSVPSQQQSEKWSCLKIVGPLEHSMVGVLAGISAVLCEASISIFALSTFDTDYLLVKTDQLIQAKSALQKAGYDI